MVTNAARQSLQFRYGNIEFLQLLLKEASCINGLLSSYRAAASLLPLRLLVYADSVIFAIYVFISSCHQHLCL